MRQRRAARLASLLVLAIVPALPRNQPVAQTLVRRRRGETDWDRRRADDIAKAGAIAGSSRCQSTAGDNGGSDGILHVRAAPDGSPGSADNGWGGCPWTQKPTALDADAHLAYPRAVDDGQSCTGNGGNRSPALKGDIRNAASTRQSGSDTGPDSHTREIQGYPASQPRRSSYPLHSAKPAGVTP
jgi:hypothetical protein